MTLVASSHGVLLLAGFFAPYSFEVQDRSHVLTPPTPIHLKDSSNRWHLRPFVYRSYSHASSMDRYEEDRSVPFTIRCFVSGQPYRVFGLFPSNLHLFGVSGNARICLLGTDAYGRDQFSRLLYGGRISLFAGIVAAFVSISLGVLAGGVAGYFGGQIDGILMRLVEIFLSVPWLYLLLTVRAVLPLDLDPLATFFLLTGVLGFLGWARPARLIRGVVLSAKARDYVLVARGFGASNSYIFFTHVLPAAFEVIATQAALYVPQFVLAEVTLSFFGLGIGEPMPSWGNMLTNLQQYLILQSSWWMFVPAFALVVVFLLYQQLFSAINEIWSA